MPIGHNLTKCRTCLREFICGDCIESECRECECKRRGHLEVGGICGRCGIKICKQDARQAYVARGVGSAPTKT